ncbi:MAG: DNA cytosine methyltransferase [Halopseudomonas aestusnigri]
MSNSKFIDLFAGCGGLSLGLIKAGWKGVFAIEKTSDAFLTLSHNLVEGKVSGFDWPEWLPKEATTTSELLKNHAEELKSLKGTVDLIAGGPPCQGFSFAGRRNPNDPRNKLTSEYIEIVQLVRPKFLLLENVKGFTAAFNDAQEPAYAEIVKKRLTELSGGGYQVYSSMVNSSLFGVPQPRPRFIMIGIRKDLLNDDNAFEDPVALAKRTAMDFRISKRLNGHNITVSEAISDLEITGKILISSPDTSSFKQIKYEQPKELTPYQALMRENLEHGEAPNSLRLPRHREHIIARFEEVLIRCPKGKSLSKEDREYFGTKKQCFTPLAPDQLSRTITTLPDDVLHYSEPRILTVRENARLQSFPDWFEFRGKYTTGGDRRKVECPRYTQVGNAVPPLMAEALGRAILSLDQKQVDS